MIRPTDSELEILQILWKSSPCSVREINDELNTIREVGYTTTLKIMQIMVEKGLVTRDTSNRSHMYTARIRESETKYNLLQDFVTNTFQGSVKAMVMSALGNGDVSREELNELARLINKIENE